MTLKETIGDTNLYESRYLSGLPEWIEIGEQEIRMRKSTGISKPISTDHYYIGAPSSCHRRTSQTLEVILTNPLAHRTKHPSETYAPQDRVENKFGRNKRQKAKQNKKREKKEIL